MPYQLSMETRLQHSECQLCERVWDKNWATTTRGFSISGIPSSNNRERLSKCHFLSYLVNAIELLCPNAKTQSQNGESCFEIRGGWIRGILRFYCCSGGGGNCDGFEFFNPEGGGILPGVRLKALSADNTCKESWSFVQEVYGNCKETHTLCKSPSSVWIPPRLLEIRDNGLRLASGPKLPSTVQFMALSYCWGSEPFIRLTSNSLEHLEDLVSYEDLPIVFRNIVTIAQRLGIGYLWIDSLCIQQDSKEDWAFHSARMSLIYESAELVIGAVTSKNPYIPFLGTGAHDSRTGASQAREIRSLESNASPVLLARRIIRGSDYAEDALGGKRQLYHKYTAVSGPLDLRAWALQERCLARRSLRYTNGELTWRCCEASRYESLVGYESSARNSSGDQPPTAPEKQEWWYSLVESYSRRAVTVDTDMLPAFSGIVSKIHKPNDRYLAGLWESTLPIDLGWCRKDWLKTPLSEWKKRGYGRSIASAPTWSWASNTFPVEWFWNTSPWIERLDDFSPEITIVNIECEPDSINVWGQVKPGACLTMKGHIVDIRILAHKSGEGYVYFVDCKDLASDILPLVSDFWLCRKHVHDNEASIQSNTTSPVYCTRAETLPDDEEVQKRDFQLEFSASALVLGKWTTGKPVTLYYTLLALEQTSSADSAYQRLGAFSTVAGDNKEIKLEEMQQRVIKLI